MYPLMLGEDAERGGGLLRQEPEALLGNPKSWKEKGERWEPPQQGQETDPPLGNLKSVLAWHCRLKARHITALRRFLFSLRP